MAALTFAPVSEVPVQDSDYDRFYEILTPRIAAWAGCPLEPTWGYGIRSDGRGCLLHLHRDRIVTHGISCIVHGTDSAHVPWPLDFIDHEGQHHRVFFEPGTVLFHESLCPHGRLVPFQGEYCRNLCFHWRPQGWDPSPLTGMRCKDPNLPTALAEWTAPAELPALWRDWLLTNLSRGCDPAALATRALAEGLDAEAVSCLLQAAQRGDGAPGASTPSLAQVDEIPDLLSAQEGEELIDSCLQPSTVTIGPHGYRTSRTCHLRDLDAPLIGVHEACPAALIGVDPTCSEPLQGQRCDRGEYFRAHTDGFDPGSQEFIEHSALGGQRSLTVMVYLNPVAAGGQTRFLHLGRTFTGKITKEILPDLLEKGGSPAALVEARGLGMISDPAVITAIADELLAAHPAEVEAFRGGKTKLQGFFVGQLMKRSGGNAGPQLAHRILAERLRRC